VGTVSAELQHCASSCWRLLRTYCGREYPRHSSQCRPRPEVVHDTVNEIEGLETTSEGLEPRRYVIIRPVSAGSAEESSTGSIEKLTIDPESRGSELKARHAWARLLAESEARYMTRSEAHDRLKRYSPKLDAGHWLETCHVSAQGALRGVPARSPCSKRSTDRFSK